MLLVTFGLVTVFGLIDHDGYRTTYLDSNTIFTYTIL